MSQSYKMIVMAIADPTCEHDNYAYCSPNDIEKFCVCINIPNHNHLWRGMSKKKIFLAALRDDFMVLTLHPNPAIKDGYLALSSSQRKRIDVVAGSSVSLSKFVPPPEFILDLIVIDINPCVKAAPQTEMIDATDLSAKLQATFLVKVFETGQAFRVDYRGKKYECLISGALRKGRKKGRYEIERGLVSKRTKIIFKTSVGGSMQIVNQNESTIRLPFGRDINVASLGLGGIRAQLDKLYTRVFYTLGLPPYMRGPNIVRGVLIHGLPGTGKTFLGRRIAEFFGNKGKFINCSDLFGQGNESAKIVKEFFISVENNQKSHGDHSDLHVLVLNDFDCIGRENWPILWQSETNGHVVFELLKKIYDEQILEQSFNNVLFIAITNRKDLIATSFLKQRRLGVEVEMTVPDEEGRLEILEMHASPLVGNNGRYAEDVRFQDIASKTHNFTGAELEGLVHSAKRIACQRVCARQGIFKCDSAVQNTDEVQTDKVTMDDFLQAISNITPITSVWKH